MLGSPEFGLPKNTTPSAYGATMNKKKKRVQQKHHKNEVRLKALEKARREEGKTKKGK